MKKYTCFLFVLIIFFSSCTSAYKKLDINGNFSDSEFKTLKDNGFFLEKTNYDNIYSLYKTLSKDNSPLLYTLDLPFYSMHLLFDNTLKEFEENALYDSLTILSKSLYKLNYDKYTNTGSDKYKDSYLLATLYFAVPLSYLDDDFSSPVGLSKFIDAEQMLIEAHKGISISPIFSYREDYSQYVPRGHYTSNDSLKRYFKAFMWYGRMGFYFLPEQSFVNATDIDSSRINMIRTSLLIYNEIKDNPRLLNIWKYINKITDFYVGSSDDISINIYDKSPVPSNLSDKNIITFINFMLNNAPMPKIVSTEKTDKEKNNKNVLCFKLLGQKYIPDSYIFQQLVYNKVNRYFGPGKVSPFTMGTGAIRAFPMGLDFAYILGSNAAGEILNSTHNSDYAGYKENTSKLKKEFNNIQPTNAYTYFLRFMQLSVNRKHYRHDPFYMKSKLWAKKILASVLSFWTMLRHDTILYAKQSYTAKLTSVRPRPEKEKHLAYLSPYGNVYKEMYEFCDKLSVLLKNDENINKHWKYKLADCKTLLLLYIKITNNEMQGNTISEKDMNKLYYSWRMWHNIGSPWQIGVKNNKDMSIVADVHTDINSKMVLEEAIGSPFKITAVANLGDKKEVFYGGVNSYFEFKYPMKNRLTDEKWRAMKNSMPIPFWEEELLIEE